MSLTDRGGHVREVRAQNIIRKKCLISPEGTSDLTFQKLFTCTYTSVLCGFHFFFFFNHAYNLQVESGSSEVIDLAYC